MDTVISKLQRNPKDIYLEASRLLRVIADNILKQPQNTRLRSLQKSNKTISNKILNIYGGLDCLKLMGFLEVGVLFTLPENASLDKLKNVRDTIIRFERLYVENNGLIPRPPQPSASADAEQSEETIKQVELPEFKKRYDNPFLNNIAYRFYRAQLHDDKYLRSRALKLIPKTQIQMNAQENMRDLQREIKNTKEGDFDTTFQDLEILELLNWFKNDFFMWVDTPSCSNCHGTTVFSHMLEDTKAYQYTNRVEMHKCESCSALTPFPRYNDLNILMETRRGRCGEWANVFTLFCRAMHWDARQVFDETDHVWTEVYSYGAKRWLHCDPCENVCDSPLIYETGWNKKITYVMAYSHEEIQDVTWRYTSDFKKVLKRRNLCTEEELLQVIMELRKERQERISEYRRKYLTKRLVSELCELMVEKKATDKDKRGRSSGSLSWRIARGEQRNQLSNFSPYIWKFFDDDLEEDLIKFRYSTATNRYEMFSGINKYFALDEWQQGLYRVENMFRKEENDWKMVYLARTEGAEVGKVTWTFEVNSLKKVFDEVDIKIDYDLFQNGRIDIVAIGDYHEIKFMKDEKHIRSKLLSGSTRIDIAATLRGGEGDVAWQHAQLFRQSRDSTEFGLEITFTFKKE